jgi:L-fucose isomerase-like protein
MPKPSVAFVVYGVHKDGLLDPQGRPFIDDSVIEASRAALASTGAEVIEHPGVIASREEARSSIGELAIRDDVDAVVLFSGTWVWAAHLVAAVRKLARTGKGVLLWTHPGSQGWRPVGGFVMHGALDEVGIPHRFVYGAAGDPTTMRHISSFCRASAVARRLDGATLGAIGGRGMGQTCGVADPSQWMRVFGIDIDSRDTTALVRLAEGVTGEELGAARARIQPLFAAPVPAGVTADRSIRLYLALKKLIAQERWDFYTIQSFPGLGDDYSATCFAQSMMIEDGVATSTLSDFNTALTVKLLMEFSGQGVYYGDLQHVDQRRREIKIIGDGACPPSLAGALEPATFAEHGIPTEGAAGGISVQLTCRAGEGVLARLGRHNGQFEMVIARCSVFEPETREELWRRKQESGIPFWPHAFVTAECDIDALLQAWSNEYAVLGYGAHLYDDLLAFCEVTGIKACAL